MSVLVIHPTGNGALLQELIKEVDPTVPVQVWPQGELTNVELAAVWAQPPGILNALPRLKLIQSLGAGIDHLLDDPSCPANIPIARITDPVTAATMAEYVTLAALSHRRQWVALIDASRAGRWMPLRSERRYSACVLGLGRVGRAVARSLQMLGYEVRGWSRRRHLIDGVRSFAADELGRAVSGVDVLVNALPLTAATRGILNRSMFQQLAHGAQLIHVGRGAHLSHSDLLASIDAGEIAQATLDVFETEPLPQTDPLWQRAEVIITPHIAAEPDRRHIAAQIARNFHAIRNGHAIEGAVEAGSEY